MHSDENPLLQALQKLNTNIASWKSATEIRFSSIESSQHELRGDMKRVLECLLPEHLSRISVLEVKCGFWGLLGGCVAFAVAQYWK